MRKLPYQKSYPGKVGQIFALTSTIAVEIQLDSALNCDSDRHNGRG
ncbi:MAG TPA: hypothetical protein V6C63_15875 [Allocoleopsis sp.]